MAIISSVFGGIIGFWSALVAFVFFDVTVAQIVMIYVATGLMTTTALILYATTCRKAESHAHTPVGATQ